MGQWYSFWYQLMANDCPCLELKNCSDLMYECNGMQNGMRDDGNVVLGIFVLTVEVIDGLHHFLVKTGGGGPY